MKQGPQTSSPAEVELEETMAVETATKAATKAATAATVESTESAIAPTLAIAPSSGDLSAAIAQSQVSASSARGKLRRWLMRGFVLGTTAVISATIGGFIGMVMPLPGASSSQKSFGLEDLWRKGFSYRITRPVNILVMGIDLPLDLPEGAEGHVFAGRSDTMMLVRINPDLNQVNILSIPRDTQVVLPDEGLSKINYANVQGGAKLAAQVVSHNLNEVPIDRYVRVSTGAFRELVDLVGGVEVYVPEKMEYEDQTQKLKIDLEPGLQTLNGEQAEGFARFRSDSFGDIGRVQRQQMMIRALREKISSPAMVTRLPQAIQIFQKYIDTNLSMDEMLALTSFGLGMQKEDFRMVMLPGRFSTPEEFEASYWLMDTMAMNQLMHNYFDLSMVQTASDYQNQTDLRIAIQNASSDPTVGAQVLAYLQDQGFANAYVIDDWSEAEAETQIIAQRGDLQSAAIVESIMGVGQIVPASTGDLESDLTIRVGEDWAKKPRL